MRISDWSSDVCSSDLKIVKTLQSMVPEDTIYTSGAGNYAGWFTRFLRYYGLARGGRTQLAPSSGAMGYGVPAGVSAKLVYPDRTVVSVSGDGCFLMNHSDERRVGQKCGVT